MQLKVKKVFSEGKTFANVIISIQKDKIVDVAINQNIEKYDYLCLAPTFFDTHINGGEKFYFTQSCNSESLADIATSSAKYGTALTLPCLITSSQENILNGIKVITDYIKNDLSSSIPGLHLEGPFLNIKKRGAHLAKYVRIPTDKEIDEILNAGSDVIKIWTIAPENFSDTQIKMIQDAGVVISAGHSNATYEESKAAFAKGIHLVTHLYNAMSSFHHRDPGLIGATLEDQSIWAPIILDGIHCDYGAARIAFQNKPDRLFIISDALFLSRKKIRFEWEEFDATLKNDQYINSDGNLAGSAISMAEAVKNAVEQVNIPLAIALSMATDRPAKAVKLDDHIGKIAPGHFAKFVSVNEVDLEFELVSLP